MVSVNPLVWRRWIENDSSIGVLIKDSPGSSLSQELIEDLVASLDLTDENGQVMAEMWVQRSVQGPGIWIGNCLPDDRRPTIDRLAQALDAAGLATAEITALPVIRPLRGQYDDMALIKAFFALRGHRPANWSGPLGWPIDEPDWILSGQVRQSCLDTLVSWALALPGAADTAAVATGMYFTPVPLAGVHPLMHAAAQSGSRNQVNMLAVSAGTRFRSVNLYFGSGLAIAAQGVTDPAVFDWSSTLAEMTSTLAGAGAWADYAHLTRGTGALWTYRADNGTAPSRASWMNSGTVTRQVPVEGGLYDAFGVFAARADSPVVIPAGGPWKADRQGPLVVYTHEDLAAWYANDSIDPAILAAARTALNDSLRP